MRTLSPAACSYEIDRQRRIVALDAAWSVFAIENGAPELAAPHPIGVSLFTYVRDSATQRLYEQIFNRVTFTGETATVPFRCDSPAMRRQLELHIAPLGFGGFRLYSTIVAEEPRTRIPLLDRGIDRAIDVVRMCSWCKRVDHGDVWLEVEEAVSALRLFDREVMPSITHALCPACETLGREVGRSGRR